MYGAFVVVFVGLLYVGFRLSGGRWGPKGVGDGGYLVVGFFVGV